MSIEIPHAKDSETALLGLLLYDREALEECEIPELLTDASVFYDYRNETIYQVILEGYNSGGGAYDMTLVVSILMRDGKMESAGGIGYVGELMNQAATRSAAKRHALLILEAYMRRKANTAGDELKSKALNKEMDIFDVIDSSCAQIEKITSITNSETVSTAAQESAITLKELIDAKNSGLTFTGVQSGISGIDSVTKGWQKTDLIILAARPSVGKTATSLNIATYAAIDTPTLYVSLEMHSRQLLQRMLADKSNVEFGAIRQPHTLTESDEHALMKGHDYIRKLKLFIDSSSGMTPARLRAKAKKLKRKHGLGLIVIDYLQLMTPNKDYGGKKNANREQEVSSISRDLKALAKEMDIPVIALCQLSRAGDNTEPQLSHLRESGAIEQDADIVAFLYRPEPEDRSKLMFSIKKHRNGELEDVALLFEGKYQRVKMPHEFSIYPETPPEPAHKTFERLRNQSEPYKDDNPF